MLKPVSYLQSDPEWGQSDYSADGEKRTIATSGCGPTCMAMVAASLADTTRTPAHTAAWAKNHGFKYPNQGTAYSYFSAHAKKFGLTITQLNSSSVYGNTSAAVHKKAKSALAGGDWLICCMGPGNWTKGGHYVLVYALKDGKVYINDPASTAPNRTCNTWAKLQKEVKYYFRVTVPEYTVITKSNPLGMYKKASLKSKRLRKVRKGQKMKLIRLCEGAFNVYEYNGTRGYSRKKYLKL